jgi:hypothetical protein
VNDNIHILNPPNNVEEETNDDESNDEEEDPEDHTNDNDENEIPEGPNEIKNIEVEDIEDGDEEIEENADVNIEENADEPEQQPTIDDQMSAAYGERKSEHNLRARRPRDYSHIHKVLESTVMTQYSMKKGIKVFGESGVNAVVEELQQLHDRKALDPKRKLSREEKKLHYII